VCSTVIERRRRQEVAMSSHENTAREPASRLRATLLLACLAQFMVILDVSVVNVALPSIGSGLHFSEVDLQWVVNAYTVSFAGFMLLGGRAADLLGRRRVSCCSRSHRWPAASPTPARC
jgi:hypothetical protein